MISVQQAGHMERGTQIIYVLLRGMSGMWTWQVTSLYLQIRAAVCVCACVCVSFEPKDVILSKCTLKGGSLGDISTTI